MIKLAAKFCSSHKTDKWPMWLYMYILVCLHAELLTLFYCSTTAFLFVPYFIPYVIGCILVDFLNRVGVDDIRTSLFFFEASYPFRPRLKMRPCNLIDPNTASSPVNHAATIIIRKLPFTLCQVKCSVNWNCFLVLPDWTFMSLFHVGVCSMYTFVISTEAFLVSS